MCLKMSCIGYRKQTRTKRRCIGKIDKETGEIVPTGGRGRKKKPKPPESTEGIDRPDEAGEPETGQEEATASDKALKKEIRELRKEIAAQQHDREKLESRIRSLEEENWKLKNASDEASRRERKRISALNSLLKDVRQLTERITQFSEEYGEP